MTERAREIRDSAEEATAQEMQRLHESGEISHLFGRPLQLDDDPDWLATRILKQQGYSHPLIERSRELDEPRRAAEAIVDRLRRRHARLTRPGYTYTAQEAETFNRARHYALEDLGDKLAVLNRAIRDFNLQAPDSLQQRPVVVEETVSWLSVDIPPLRPSVPADSTQSMHTPLWRRVLRKT
jgi:hypothetical protein